MLPAPISIPSVNKNTAATIISALLASNGITRTDLAGACSVSAMTAGKVVTAMCDAGYACICEEFSVHGRRTDFIYPSGSFTFLIFDIGERTMSANLYDALENTSFTYTQPRNESVDITADARSFVALVNEQISDIGQSDTYRLSALLYNKSISLNVKILEREMPFSIAIEKSVAASEYVNTKYPSECVAFIGGSDGSDISIISDGKIVAGRSKPKKLGAKILRSEIDMLDTITEKLVSLFDFVMPDKVILESRSLHLSRRFSDELCERLCTSTSMQKEELPELVTNDGIPFPSRAVIGQLINIYANLISAN